MNEMNDGSLAALPGADARADDSLQIAPAVRALTSERVLEIEHELLRQAGASADQTARENLFVRRQRRRAWNTVRSEIECLTIFMSYLQAAGVPLSFHLAEEPRLWRAITFGLVEGFLLWEEQQGYRIKTLNNHLSILKLYARMAHDAGMQDADQFLAISHLPSIRGAEGQRIDEARQQAGLPTSRGHKKPQPTFLERREEFNALLHRPATPHGKRDLVAVLLMYDLSLRPSEVVALTIGDLHLEEGKLDVYRQKTNDHQILRLTQRLLVALPQYLAARIDRSKEAPLLVRSLKNGNLVEAITRTPSVRRPDLARKSDPLARQLKAKLRREPEEKTQEAAPVGTLWTPPMTTRALRERLHEIGLDIEDTLYGESRLPAERINLTSYDGRHEWTRRAVRGGSDPIAVTKAGGWKGQSEMVLRYYGELQVANEDIILER